MNSFLSNSTYRITFEANNIATANLISPLIGNKIVQQESSNKPKFIDLNPASRSLHISETQRALLLPQEVIMLLRDHQIILMESTYPIKTKKILYYSGSTFTKRLLKQTRVPTQEPYDPNKDLSAAVSKDKVNNEGNNTLEGTNSVDYPAETKTEAAVYDESDEFADEDIDDKFEDDDDGFDDERSDDGFDDEDEEDEFEDEDINDILKDDQK